MYNSREALSGGLLMCMHYRIFIEDGDFELACITPNHFAP